MGLMTGRNLTWTVAVVFGVADQITKAIVAAALSSGRGIVVVPGFFDLTLVTNAGGIFGILRDVDGALRGILFSAIPAAAILLMVWYGHTLPPGRRWSHAALGLILGGASGNLLDRLRLGHVVDFLDVYVGRHHWPAFNLADSCICVGVTMLLIEGLFFHYASDGPAPAPPPAAP
jgi:signal peptidase II